MPVLFHMRLLDECNRSIEDVQKWAIPLVQCIQSIPKGYLSSRIAEQLTPLVPLLPIRQLGLIANAFAQVPLEMHGEIMRVIARQVEKSELSARDAAHLLNAWAKSGAKVALPQNILEGWKVENASPQTLANILHGATKYRFGKAHFTTPRFLERVKEITVRGEWKPQELCLVVWSYANMRTINVLDFLEDPCVNALQELKEVEVVMLVTACAKARWFPPMLSKGLDERLDPMFEHMKAGDFAIVCNALTKWPQSLALKQLLSATKRSRWSFLPKHAAYVLQAYAKFGIRDERVFHSVCDTLEFESLLPMNAAHIMVALAKVDIRRPPQPFYQFFRRCEEFTNESLLGVLYAWLHCYFSPAPLSKLLLETDRREMDSESFAIQSSTALRVFFVEINLAQCSLELLRALRRIEERGNKWQTGLSLRNSNFEEEVEVFLDNPARQHCVFPFQIDFLSHARGNNG